MPIKYSKKKKIKNKFLQKNKKKRNLSRKKKKILQRKKKKYSNKKNLSKIHGGNYNTEYIKDNRFPILQSVMAEKKKILEMSTRKKGSPGEPEPIQVEPNPGEVGQEEVGQEDAGQVTNIPGIKEISEESEGNNFNTKKIKIEEYILNLFDSESLKSNDIKISSDGDDLIVIIGDLKGGVPVNKKEKLEFRFSTSFIPSSIHKVYPILNRSFGSIESIKRYFIKSIILENFDIRGPGHFFWFVNKHRVKKFLPLSISNSEKREKIQEDLKNCESIFRKILDKIEEIEEESQSNNGPELEAFNKNFKDVLTNIINMYK